MTEQRRLAAIVSADVTGYSRLMGRDESGTLAALKSLRRDVVDPAVGTHGGRIVKTTGDGLLLEFPSVVNAVRCAIEVQSAMADRTAGIAEDQRIAFRVGINIGDIIVEGDDIFGDGVNVAARLQEIAAPGGICISGRVHEDVRDRLDASFDEGGAQTLKNIVRPVQTWHWRPSAVEAKPAPTPIALPLPDKPSIAVLPFQNMSGDPEQEYFADGIAEDIITAMSRYPSLFVIARNSSFTYKGRAIDVKLVGRELGVRYVLEGSLRKFGNRIRVTAQLVEAEVGNHVWAERYDRDLADIFSLQDEITETVIVAIAPAIAYAEQSRALRKPPGSLDAWAAYQRGLWHMGKFSAVDNALAQELFQQAIDLDPNFAGGYGALAIAQLQSAGVFHKHTLTEVQSTAEVAARKAVALDGADAEARLSLAFALLTRGDLEGALIESERALEISPNLASAHGQLGQVLIFTGRPKEGLVALETCLRLDPRGPWVAVRLLHVAVAFYFLCEYESSLETLKRVIRSYPDYPSSHRWLVAGLGQAGHVEEAKEALRKAIAITPGSFEMYVRKRVPWHRPEDHAHFLEGLRKAGWRET